MATIQQVKQQITRQEQAFQQAKQQLAQAKTRIPITQAQLLQQRGIASREKLRQEQQKRTKEIQQARQKLISQEQKFKKQIEPVKTQISSYESAVARQQAEAAEWKEAIRLARSGSPEQRLHIPKSIQKKMDDILGGATPPGIKTVPYDPVILEKYQKELEAQKISLDLSQVQVPDIPGVFQPQDLPFDVKQTYQIGVDISGKPVYSTKQPDISYTPPSWGFSGQTGEYDIKETQKALKKLKVPETRVSEISVPKIKEQEISRDIYAPVHEVILSSQVPLGERFDILKYKTIYGSDRFLGVKPIIKGAKTTYTSAEVVTSEKIKQTDVGKYVYEKAPVVSEYITEKFPLKKISGLYEVKDSKVVSVGLPEETQEALITGLIQAPIDKPVKTGIMFGAGYGLGKIGGAAITFLSKGGIAGKTAVGMLKYGVPGAYAVGKGVEYAIEPDPYKRGYEVGETISTELFPMITGFQLSKYDKVLINKFIKQQKTIFKDIEGKAGRRKTKQVQKEKVQVKEVKKKIDVDSVINDLRYKQEGTVIRNKNFQEKLSDVRKILGKVKTQEELESLKKLFLETYGEQEATRLMTEFYGQEIGVIPQGRFAETIPEGRISFLGTMGTKRVEVSEIEKVKQPKIIKDIQIEKEKPELKKAVKLITGLGYIQTEFPKEKQRDILLLGQPSVLKQPIKLKQPQLEKEKQKSALLISPRYVQIQKQIPRLRQPSGFQPTVPFHPTRAIPKPRPPFIPMLTPEELFKKKIYGKKRISKRVIPYGRRRGKFIQIGKPTTFEMARKKAIRFLKRTLGATIEIRTPTGKRLPIGKVSKEFRPGKKGKDIMQLVQIKETRLGTKEERLEIIRARKGRIKFI